MKLEKHRLGLKISALLGCHILWPVQFRRKCQKVKLTYSVLKFPLLWIFPHPFLICRSERGGNALLVFPARRETFAKLGWRVCTCEGLTFSFFTPSNQISGESVLKLWGVYILAAVTLLYGTGRKGVVIITRDKGVVCLNHKFLVLSRGCISSRNPGFNFSPLYN